MRKTLLTPALLIAAVLLFGNSINAQSGNSPNSRLRHIVIITFKPDVAPDSIKALDNVYTDLSKSPLVADFESGVNVSTRDSGMVKHIYVTTFASKDDMKSYAKIPGFEKLFRISLPIADDVTVVDYWINK